MNRLLHSAVLLVACGSVTVGGVLLTVPSLLSYDTVKAKMNSLSNHGRIDSLTPALYARAMNCSRLAGVVLIAGGGAAWLVRRRVEEALRLGTVALRSSMPDLAVYLRTLRPSPLAAWLLLAAGALGVVLRLRFLWEPVRYDEAFCFLSFLTKPFYIAPLYYGEPNNHVFHTLLAWPVCRIFGDSVAVLRIPALLAGIAIIPATYAAGCALYNQKAGVLAAWLSATSVPLIEYSTNGRGYSLFTLFFLVLLILAPQLRRPNQWIAWVIFTVISGLGFYTIPTMLYPYAIDMVWLLLSATTAAMTSVERKKFLATWLASGVATVALTVVLYGPIIAICGIQSLAGNAYVRGLDLAEWQRRFTTELQVARDACNYGLNMTVVVTLAAGVVIGLLLHKKLGRDAWPVGLIAVVVCLAEMALHRVVPPARVWQFLLPLYFVMAAAGLAWLMSWAERRSRAAAGALLVGTIVFTAGWPSLNLLRAESLPAVLDSAVCRDGPAIADWLREHMRSDDHVFAPCPWNYPIRYNLRQSGGDTKQFLFGDFTAGQCFLVVGQSPAPTLEKTLADGPPSFRARTTTVEMVRKFPSATLYRLTLTTDEPVHVSTDTNRGS